jgi:hypothetical protein
VCGGVRRRALPGLGTQITQKTRMITKRNERTWRFGLTWKNMEMENNEINVKISIYSIIFLLIFLIVLCSIFMGH